MLIFTLIMWLFVTQQISFVRKNYDKISVCVAVLVVLLYSDRSRCKTNALTQL